MKKFSAMLLVLAMVFSLAACGGGGTSTVEPPASPAADSSAPASSTPPASSTEPASPAAPAVEPLKVAVLLPGLISDAGWNAGGYYGTVYLNENVEGVECTYIENIGTTNADAAIRDYCEQGYDLIVGWSFDHGDYLMAVAPEYPDINFVWAQGFKTMENLSTISAPLQETAYLCGIIAAEMSETGVVGYIGGVDTVPQINALEGFRDGIAAANPDVKLVHAFPGTWSDVEKGKQTALAMFEQGVDVLMGRGDGVALGCMQACIENDVYCFGDVDDQNSLAPELMLTSTVWNVGKNLEYVIEDIRADKFGDFKYNLGMAQGVTDICDYHGLVPDDVAAKVEEARQKIMSGELVIEAKSEITAQ